LIDRHPDTRFIIDHLAILQPRTPPAPPQPWADLPKVLDLAKRQNAVIKVSGACTLSRAFRHGAELKTPAHIAPADHGEGLKALFGELAKLIGNGP
jgi:predicted TIM-barrel fold metal-dependent hydrolase